MGEKKVNFLIKLFNKVFNGLLIIIFSSMTLIVFFNVILRYIFHSGITWSDEGSRYLFVWLVFLGAIAALKQHAHLGVDLLVGKVSINYQKILFVISNIVIIISLIISLWGLYEMIQLDKNIPSSAMGIPINVLPLAAVIASFLMIIISILQVINFVILNKDAPPWIENNDENSTRGLSE